MYERILEIIAYILKELRIRKSFDDIDYNVLSKIGYSDTEINTAIAWVHQKLESQELIAKTNIDGTSAIRFFNPEEQKMFSPDALGYLTQSVELGIISGEDREMILDRVTMSGYSRIELNEMKLIISTLVLRANNPINRLILNNNETAN